MFSAAAAKWGARRGTLVINGHELATPSFIVSTTRGAVDHLTPDHAPPAPMTGIYAEELFDREGLVEECMLDRKKLPLRTRVLLGSVRKPGSRPILNKPNTADSIGIDTVQGSRLVSIDTITHFMGLLKPDIFLVPYDNPAQSQSNRVGHNRLHKMQIRSSEWFQQFVRKRLEMGANSGDLLLIAQIPPELRTQDYIAKIDDLCDAYCFSASEVGSNNDIPEDLVNPGKLRFSNKINSDWRQVIEDIEAGSDIVPVPVTNFSNAGQALMFRWGEAALETPFMLDLNDSKFTTDMQKLGDTGHAYAYIHHLLEAKEMTAQVLLQQHNLKIVEQLFADIRKSLEEGSFKEDSETFFAAYSL